MAFSYFGAILSDARSNKRVDEAYLKSLAPGCGVQMSDLANSDADDVEVDACQSGVWIKKITKMKAEPNAPAVNAEEIATVQIGIGAPHKE